MCVSVRVRVCARLHERARARVCVHVRERTGRSSSKMLRRWVVASCLPWGWNFPWL